MTTKLNTTRARTTSGKIFSTSNGQFLFIFFSLFFRKLVVDGLQPLAKIKHRIALAGEQGIHAYSGFRCELFEAAALEFVGTEYVALLFGQLIQCIFQLI